jgi:hypothetical protein
MTRQLFLSSMAGSRLRLHVKVMSLLVVLTVEIGMLSLTHGSPALSPELDKFQDVMEFSVKLPPTLTDKYSDKEGVKLLKQNIDYLLFDLSNLAEKENFKVPELNIPEVVQVHGYILDTLKSDLDISFLSQLKALRKLLEYSFKSSKTGYPMTRRVIAAFIMHKQLSSHDWIDEEVEEAVHIAGSLYMLHRRG